MNQLEAKRSRWSSVGEQHLMQERVDGREADELGDLQLVDHLEPEVLDERQQQEQLAEAPVRLERPTALDVLLELQQERVSPGAHAFAPHQASRVCPVEQRAKSVG